jgi:hypothetical protein
MARWTELRTRQSDEVRRWERPIDADGLPFVIPVTRVCFGIRSGGSSIVNGKKLLDAKLYPEAEATFKKIVAGEPANKERPGLAYDVLGFTSGVAGHGWLIFAPQS